MTVPIVSRAQLRILAALAGGAWLSRSGGRFLLRRGRHVRGVRSCAVQRLYTLLLIRGGVITEAGWLVLAVETCS
jgi:hypothetical protein